MDGCIWLRGEGYFVPREIQYYNARTFGRFPDGTYGFIVWTEDGWKRA